MDARLNLEEKVYSQISQTLTPSVPVLTVRLREVECVQLTESQDIATPVSYSVKAEPIRNEYTSV